MIGLLALFSLLLLGLMKIDARDTFEMGKRTDIYFKLFTSYTESMALLDGSFINANDTRFWVNRETSSGCPPSIPIEQCPRGHETVFNQLADGGLALNSESPGGQFVYIEDFTGQLRFTSTGLFSIPENSCVDKLMSLKKGKKDTRDGYKIFPGWIPWLCKQDMEFEDHILYFVREGASPPPYDNSLVVGVVACSKVTLNVRFVRPNGPSAWEYV